MLVRSRKWLDVRIGALNGGEATTRHLEFPAYFNDSQRQATKLRMPEPFWE